MIAEQTSPAPEIVNLKHMALDPEVLRCQTGTTILLKVAYSLEHAHRKFLFLLEQTDEESPPLSEGEQYLFEKPLTEAGAYNLQCLNYPKVRCNIDV